MSKGVNRQKAYAMDTNHEAASFIQPEKEKRSSRYLNFKLQPGDEALLDLLPQRQSELMTAEGSYQEIAQRFNLPIGTVRSRLHRARAALEKLRESQAQADGPDRPQ